MSFFPDHPKDCLFYDRALQQRNQLLKNNEKDVAWFLAIEKQLAEVGYRIDSNRRKVIDILTQAWGEANIPFKLFKTTRVGYFRQSIFD